MKLIITISFILQCIVLIGACLLVYSETLPRLHMEMESVCVDGAAILVSLHALTAMPISCTVWYKDQGRTQSVVNKTQVISVTDNNVTLSNLKKATQYLVHVVCDDNESLQKTVITGKCLSDQQSNRHDDEPDVTYKEEAIFSSSAVDIVLGLMFSVAAIITLSMTAYYMYRKYQRRRRLQQFLSTPHTDPFESLQSYMEEDS